MIAHGTDLILLLAGAFVGALVSGVCGFGGGILILPLVVAIVGPRVAVPFLTFGLLFSNGTRVLLLRRFVVWSSLWRYVLGAIPGALIGAVIFTKLPVGLVTRSIGALLIITVVIRRWKREDLLAGHSWILAPVGAVIGFLSAIWGAVGPLAVPFFLATGLRKERFVATIGLGALLIHVAKLTVYEHYDLMSWGLVKTGLVFGALMIIGTWVGKQILVRTTPRIFLILVDILLVIVGVVFLLRA